MHRLREDSSAHPAARVDGVPRSRTSVCAGRVSATFHWALWRARVEASEAHLSVFGLRENVYLARISFLEEFRIRQL